MHIWWQLHKQGTCQSDSMCSKVTKPPEPLKCSKPNYINAKVNTDKQNIHMQFSTYVEFAKIHSS